uniref:Evasin n=1 Tax=Amblyomma triste TaxID=251400 RepID=A0A023G9R1_AMBTT
MTTTSAALIFLLYISQLLVVFSGNEVSDPPLIDEDCEYYDPSEDNITCTIRSLNTTGRPIPVGCLAMCENSTRRLHNGTECLGISDKVANRMQGNVTYTCPVGLCYRGVCDRNGLGIDCWHNTPPPNSTNVTTNASTTSLPTSSRDL